MKNPPFSSVWEVQKRLLGLFEGGLPQTKNNKTLLFCLNVTKKFGPFSLANLKIIDFKDKTDRHFIHIQDNFF
jgi:hypothetical protein